MITLKEWQIEADNNLRSTLMGGVVVAATGSGKTILGLNLIEQNPNKKFLIVVPTIVLMNQWRKEITTVFKLAREDEISYMGGGQRDLPDKRITIAVINSLRNINWNHSLAKFDYSIFDECHRYASGENIKPITNGNLGFTVGLTATLRRPDGKEIDILKQLGPVVYTLTRQDSIDAGYICDYDVKIVSCLMSPIEAAKYVGIDNDVKQHMRLFNNNFKMINTVKNAGPRHVMFRHAIKAMTLIQERKSAVTRVKSKIKQAVKICEDNRDKKIIIFDELQESANDIYKELIGIGIPCVIYHSGIGIKDKREAIKKYISGEVNVIVSVRCLDEGLDVKRTDLGIIVNGNSQERQISQRLGRILRQEDGKRATLYMLYAPNTVDERYLKERMKVIGKIGDDEDGFES